MERGVEDVFQTLGIFLFNDPKMVLRLAFFEENGEGEQMMKSKGPIVTRGKGGA